MIGNIDSASLCKLMLVVLFGVLRTSAFGSVYVSAEINTHHEADDSQGQADKAKEAGSAAQEANKAANTSLAAAETAKQKALQADAAAGVALNGSTNVKDNVTAQVVLLPRKQAERVFSKEIARHYAVVQVTINNQSKDAAFLLQSIFVDYRGWALSGMSPSSRNTCQVQASSQAPSCPGEVASVESRVIRGELQDAATWTWRNGIIRAAVLVGAVASGIPAFGSKNALKYVSAYNGQLVPGAQVFWPDETVPQLNRVSDLGFQTNKVIPKETADIVYAFFPIDRFLTPGIRNIFLNAPAVFFAPAQIFVDKHVGKHCWRPGICLAQSDVDEMKILIENLTDKVVAARCKTDLQNVTGFCLDESKQPNDKQENDNQNKDKQKKDNQKTPSQNERDEKMLALLTMDCSIEAAQVQAVPKAAEGIQDQPAKAQAPRLPDGCQIALPIQKIVERVSLNSISIVAQGVMTVDVTTVPGSITDLVFDKGNGSPDVWRETNTPLDAAISGRFLSGGTPSVTSIEPPAEQSANIADYLDPKIISVVANDSNDTRIRFQLKWKKAIPSGSKLHFQITKYDSKDKNKASGVNSMDFVLSVVYTPVISAITVENGGVSTTWNAGQKVTGNIAGTSLSSGTPDLPKISVASDPRQYADVATDTTKTNDAGNLHFTLALKKPVPTGTILTFQVTTGSGDKAVTSNTADYTVPFK